MFACVAYRHISLNVSWSTIDHGESVAQTNLVMTSFVSSTFRPPEHPLLRLLDFHASFGILCNKVLLVGVLLTLQGVVDPRMRLPVVHPERVSVAVS